MGRIYLNQCGVGDILEDVFVITGKQFAATATGKHFIKAQVSDRTAQLNARMWNATREIFNALPEAGFVKLRGRIENYQNNLQFIIENTWAAREGSYQLGDLIPHTTQNIKQMCDQLHEICGSIQNRHLSALIHAYLDDESLMGRFCKAPAAQSFHHAFIGGLLEHTLNSMKVADAVVKFYPGLNRDLILAGIFLHDIAKTWELTYECAFAYSDGGQLVGHIVKSAIWVEEYAKKAEATLGEPIPRTLLDVLQHIILSHHGLPEFGSPRVPLTPEALVVHALENLDAKLMMALGATRDPNGMGDGNWTEYLKAFGGRLYRPDVAPEDAAVEETEPSASGAPTTNMTINNPLFESAKVKK